MESFMEEEERREEKQIKSSLELAAAVLLLLPELVERYSAGEGRRPSRVEALSAFIWTVLVSATGMSRSEPDKICSVTNAVNVRTRANPPLSEYYFGNYIVFSSAKAAAVSGGVELVQKMREAGKAVDGEYVAWWKEGENVMKEMMIRAQVEEVGRFTFSF